jgi:hypothetical protein
VKLGDFVTLGDYVTLGNFVKLGNFVTSIDLNEISRQNFKKLGDYHLFTKWVTKDRMSPNFHGSKIIKYERGAIIEVPEAQVNDQQCASGLHVFRFGQKPEWHGLCGANHELIPLTVRVYWEDICFAGLPTMDAKLRVRKLEVLD